MDEIDKKQLYNTAWKHWGGTTQLDILIEEMAELTQAILKTRRNGVTYSYAVYEEIADVSICLEQVETRLKIYPRISKNHIAGDNGYDWDTVLEIKEKKLEQLKERLMQSIVGVA